jgi:hypothetical protein
MTVLFGRERRPASARPFPGNFVGSRNVAGDDGAARPGSGHASQVDARLFGAPPGQG